MKKYSSLYENENSISVNIDNEIYGINPTFPININSIIQDILSISKIDYIRNNGIFISVKISKIQFIKILTFVYQKLKTLSYINLFEAFKIILNLPEFNNLITNKIHQVLDNDINIQLYSINKNLKFDSNQYLVLEIIYRYK